MTRLTKTVELQNRAFQHRRPDGTVLNTHVGKMAEESGRGAGAITGRTKKKEKLFPV